MVRLKHATRTFPLSQDMKWLSYMPYALQDQPLGPDSRKEHVWLDGVLVAIYDIPAAAEQWPDKECTPRQEEYHAAGPSKRFKRATRGVNNHLRRRVWTADAAKAVCVFLGIIHVSL